MPVLMSRRAWGRLVLAGAGGLALGATRQVSSGSAIRGVEVGVQSYSFRDRELHEAIDAMATIGLGSCELWQGHVEPRGRSRAELRQWRLMAPLDALTTVRGMFERAGVRLSAYNLSFRDDFTDEEIDRGFEMARALGVDLITASSTLSVVPRLVPAASRHGVTVALHNHSNMDPNEIARPTDYEKAGALAAESPIAVNLDIGHYTAANFDAVELLSQHHDRVRALHIKDRLRDDGPNVVWGGGDAPIGQVLRLLRDRRWPIPANIEYEYDGDDTVEEVARCFDYCKAALEA